MEVVEDAFEESLMKKRDPEQNESASRLIDERIAELGGWRGDMLTKIRALIHEAVPEVVEEWKWA